MDSLEFTHVVAATGIEIRSFERIPEAGGPDVSIASPRVSRPRLPHSMSEKPPDKERPRTFLDGENVQPWLHRANELKPGFKDSLTFLVFLERRNWPYKPAVDVISVSVVYGPYSSIK